ncbi:MAG: hypothetical protein EBY56_09580 [Actinobacteria bacterium]|nr:hypothetical protein [Actinomycetota bacterium]
MKSLWRWTVAITAIPVAVTGVLSSAQASSPAASTSARAFVPADVPAAVPASSPSSLSYSQIRTELVTASRALTDAQEVVTAARSNSTAATIAVVEANKDVASAEETLAQALRVVDLTSSSATAAQQQLDDRARTMYIGGGDAPGLSRDYRKIERCGDWLTKLLARVGFEGENLREAWAIVMRESGGNEDAISVTNDLGLFQINTFAWSGQDWFNRELLLTREYNAQVALMLSQGGKSWYAWGLDGQGRLNPGAYVNSGWSDEQINGLLDRYLRWYKSYPCRPAYEA